MRKWSVSLRHVGGVVLLGVMLAAVALFSTGLSGASGSDIEEAKARLADANLRYEEAHGALHELGERVERLSVREERATRELEQLNLRLQQSGWRTIGAARR